MRGPALMDEAGNIVFLLNTGDDGLSFGNSVNRNEAEALSGARFTYHVGSFYSVKISASMVSSLDAERIRQWWRERIPLTFDPRAQIGEDNLVINGDGALGDNTMFPVFSYDGESFVRVSGTGGVRGDQYFEIDDPTAYYELSAEYRSFVSSQAVRIGLTWYDKDLNGINPGYVNRLAMSKLFAAANPNSSYIDVVKDAAGTWSMGSGRVIAFDVRSDMSGAPYFGNISVTSMDTSPSSYWRIFFSTTIDSSYPVGIGVGLMPAGNAANAYVLNTAGTPSSDWQSFTGSFGGVTSLGYAGSALNAMPPFTRFVRLYFDMCRTFSGPAFVKNISFRKIDNVAVTNSVFISNRTDPVSRPVKGDPTLLGCTINLESF